MFTVNIRVEIVRGTNSVPLEFVFVPICRKDDLLISTHSEGICALSIILKDDIATSQLLNRALNFSLQSIEELSKQYGYKWQ